MNRNISRALWPLLLVAAFVAGWALRPLAGGGGRTAAAGPENVAKTKAPGGETRAEMRNVIFHLDDNLPLDVRYLDGKFVATQQGQPVAFDDKNSFVMEIESGEVGMSGEALSHLLNDYVFAYSDAPVEDLKVSFEGNQIKQKGQLKKGVEIPFEMTAGVSVTSDGRLKLHPTKFKALKIPAKGLMKAFDIELDDLMNVKGASGVEVHDNDLYLDPELVMPAPKIRGKLTAVRIENGQMIQTFGKPQKREASGKADDGNYMAFRGGVLRFGKLTMRDADLQLVDADKKDAFSFSLDHYQKQLVAGYSKTTPDNGLVVHMPDLHKVNQPVKPAKQ